jgi:hypothetical protein
MCGFSNEQAHRHARAGISALYITAFPWSDKSRIADTGRHEQNDGCPVKCMNRSRYIIIGVFAMLTILILPRLRPTADASNRIRNAYHKAEAPVLRPGSDLPEVEQFARDLRAIDLSGAPDEVEKALNALIVTVEANAVDRRVGGDTNAANDRVAMAKRDLLRTLDKWRGQPF